jgi:hypothetical protein
MSKRKWDLESRLEPFVSSSGIEMSKDMVAVFKKEEDIYQIAKTMVKLVRDKKTRFPLKRSFLKYADVVLMFKSIMAFDERSRWKREPYATFEEKEAVIALPLTIPKDGVTAPLWLSYDEDMYLKMDRIVDYFIEESRVKSHRLRSRVSPWDAWQNDDVFVRSALERILRAGDCFDGPTLREAVYKDRRIQECAHEKTSFLLAVLRLLAPPSARVFDACCGWGDRLVASIAFGASRYVAVEPNSASQSGFKEMAQLLTPLRFGSDAGVSADAIEVVCDGMPMAALPPDAKAATFDVAFVSPPSFTSEMYSADKRQSVAMFREEHAWNVGFLFPTLLRTWDLVKEGGVMIIQSILITRINPFVAAHCNGAEFHGVVSVECGSGRFKPLWVWRKQTKDAKFQNPQRASGVSAMQEHFGDLERELKGGGFAKEVAACLELNT